MEIFAEIKINSFRKNNSIFNDEEKKKSFLSLNKNSLFLKRIIEIKEREINSSKKLLGIKSIQFENKNENTKNFETLQNQSISKIYKNPQYFQKILRKTKADYPNKRKANKYSSNIKTISNHNTSNSNSSHKNWLNSSFYRRYFNKSFFEKCSMNPFFSPKLMSQFNKGDVLNCKTESRVLSFNGRKMFAPLSLSKLNNKTNINALKLNNNESELYRNYHDLKLKKEEVYNRILKQNLSAENRLIINIKKDKEIKEQTIDNITKSINSNKTKKIPKGNKKLKNIKKDYKEENNKNMHKNNNNTIEIVSSKYNNHSLKIKNKNIHKIYNLKFKKNIHVNKINNNNNKCISSTINNRTKFRTINNSNININDENKENISPNIINRNINRNLPNFFSGSSNNNKKTMLKKYIVSNIIKESIFHSKDNKLALKIHTLKNLNQIFRKNKRYNLTLSVENFHFNIPNNNISIKNNKNKANFPSKSKSHKKMIELATIDE